VSPAGRRDRESAAREHESGRRSGCNGDDDDGDDDDDDDDDDDNDDYDNHGPT
jgi:hypothetical protein